MPSLRDLPQKYPELFKSEVYPFECGDGWYHLLETLLSYIKHTLGRHREVQRIKQRLLQEGKNLAEYQWIEDYFRDHPIDPLATFEIYQIKEKFGGLRFYWGTEVASEEISRISGAVDLAESLSTCFCETCGSNTEVATRCSDGKNWIRTLCREHRQQDENHPSLSSGTN